jgi:dUTP pyrophosphatase
LVHDKVGTFGDDRQLVVGDERRDLDDHVPRRIEAGHLEVDPDEHVGDSRVRPVRPVLDIPIVRLDPDLPLPSYAHDGDAGVDLVAREDATLAPGGGRALVPTGIALALPDGYAGFVQPRSGLALKHGVTCLNTPGLIDSGYRDELRVLLVNTDPTEPFTVRRGDRIAQLVVQTVERCAFVVVDSLPDSSRGTGGFGSSGT